MYSAQSLLAVLAAFAATAYADSIMVTPHTQYSSSVGVLGCKINTNRAAFFPSAPQCDNMCIRVTEPTSGRALNLLHLDQSGGAFDISYDAYNFLVSGNALTTGGPAITGGQVPMTFDFVGMDDPDCQALLDPSTNGKLAFSAANSVNFISSCVTSAPGSFVANNYEFFNIANPTCTLGIDEVCSLTPADFAAGLNQPSCPSGLGSQATLDEGPNKVEDFVFGTTQTTPAV